MALEIEWKFLVTHLPALPDVPGVRIDQGYLDADAKPSVRARIKGDQGYLNLKSEVAGTREAGGPQTCHEFDYPIPLSDAEQLLELARHRVQKTRYVLPDGLELDVFHGVHEGLVLAELEVEEGDPPPDPPEGWSWRNVSADRRFSNRWLAEHGLPEGAELAR